LTTSKRVVNFAQNAWSTSLKRGGQVPAKPVVNFVQMGWSTPVQIGHAQREDAQKTSSPSSRYPEIPIGRSGERLEDLCSVRLVSIQIALPN
jgi:hypothetical protein